MTLDKTKLIVCSEPLHLCVTGRPRKSMDTKWSERLPTIKGLPFGTNSLALSCFVLHPTGVQRQQPSPAPSLSSLVRDETVTQLTKDPRRIGG